MKDEGLLGIYRCLKGFVGIIGLIVNGFFQGGGGDDIADIPKDKMDIFASNLISIVRLGFNVELIKPLLSELKRSLMNNVITLWTLLKLLTQHDKPELTDAQVWEECNKLLPTTDPSTTDSPNKHLAQLLDAVKVQLDLSGVQGGAVIEYVTYNNKKFIVRYSDSRAYIGKKHRIYLEDIAGKYTVIDQYAKHTKKQLYTILQNKNIKISKNALKQDMVKALQNHKLSKKH